MADIEEFSIHFEEYGASRPAEKTPTPITTSTVAADRKADDFQENIKVYGIGKPRRVITKARISD